MYLRVLRRLRQSLRGCRWATSHRRPYRRDQIWNRRSAEQRRIDEQRDRAVDGKAARRGASPTARVGGLRYCQGPRLGIRWTPWFRLTTDRSNPLVALKWSTTRIGDRLETAIMQTLVLLVLSMVAGRANECLLIGQVGT